MRIGLAYPQYERFPKWDWIAEAFTRCGHEVTPIRSIPVLKAADNDCDCILFAQYGAGLSDIAFHARNHKSFWVTWQFDTLCLQANKPLLQQPGLQRLFDREWIPTTQLLNLKGMDLVLVKDRAILSEIKSLGIVAEYFDQACPSGMAACEHSETPEWDVLVYGSSEEPWVERRHDVTVLLEGGFAVAWAGHHGESSPRGALALPYCPPLQLPELASHAAVTLCSDFRSDMDGYWSDRLWLALGMGACVVRRDTPGLPAPEGELPYAVYQSDADMLATVARLRKDHEERRRLGTMARQWVMTNHTYENRVREFLAKVEECKHQSRAQFAGCATARE